MPEGKRERKREQEREWEGEEVITSQGNNVSKSRVYWRHIWQSTWKQNLATRKLIVFFCTSNLERKREGEREKKRGRNGEETDKQADRE